MMEEYYVSFIGIWALLTLIVIEAIISSLFSIKLIVISRCTDHKIKRIFSVD